MVIIADSIPALIQTGFVQIASFFSLVLGKPLLSRAVSVVVCFYVDLCFVYIPQRLQQTVT